jgi:hypothetical protein
MNLIQKHLLGDSEKPEWLEYPQQLVELVKSGKVDITPWHISEVDAVRIGRSHFARRVGRDLVMFAYRQDQEDVACFEKGKGQMVMLVHDNCDSPYEHVGSYPTFADWLKAAEEESRDWGESA